MPIPCPTLSWQQSPQKSLQRTLSDESLCSGRREPSFASPASLEPGLPSDVLFSSTCSFPSSTLPARRQHQHQHPHPPSGAPSTIPATGNGFPEKKCEPGHLGLQVPQGRWGAPGAHVWLGLVREGRVYRCSREPQGANITGPLGHLKPEEVGPPAPTQGQVITSSAPPATMPCQPPCSFPEHFLSDLTSPNMPYLLGFLGETSTPSFHLAGIY